MGNANKEKAIARGKEARAEELETWGRAVRRITTGCVEEKKKEEEEPKRGQESAQSSTKFLRSFLWNLGSAIRNPLASDPSWMPNNSQSIYGDHDFQDFAPYYCDVTATCAELTSWADLKAQFRSRLQWGTPNWWLGLEFSYRNRRFKMP